LQICIHARQYNGFEMNSSSFDGTANFLGRVKRMVASIKISAVSLILAAAVSPAMADSFLEQPGPGQNLDNYFALDAGKTSATDLCSGMPSGTSGCKDTAVLYRAAIGSQITPMWGIEVSYGDLGHASAGKLGSVSVDWQIHAIQVSGTGIFPVSDAFLLIGKLGIARPDLKLTGGGNSINETNTNLAFGVGAQYDFTKSFAMRVQYEDLGTVGNTNTTGTAKVKLLSAGIVVGWF
jgi:opacity protein-like surface antigen